VRGLLAKAVAGAKAEKTPLAHVLLHGPPGLGKTKLAEAMAAEMGSRIETATGTTAADPLLLVSLLTSLRAGDVLFVDEIHAMPEHAAIIFYQAMQSRRLTLAVVDGAEARSIAVDLEPFTLVGATTEPHLLSKPLLDRFAIKAELERYSKDEIGRIVRGEVEKKGSSIAADAVAKVAEVSWGTARVALNLLAVVWLHTLARTGGRGRAAAGKLVVTLQDVVLALAALGIDHRGLDRAAQRVLEVLARNPAVPVGRRRLAAQADTSQAVFKTMVEPQLLLAGLVDVTPRGIKLVNGRSRPPGWRARATPMVQEALEPYGNASGEAYESPPELMPAGWN
jgi:Holliday junction DNA helicase RuvB